MSDTFSLAKLEQATQLLAQCNTVREAMDYFDMAEAARHYAQVSGMGLEAQNYAAEIKMRAGRRMREVYESSDKAKGTRGNIQEQLTGGAPMGPARENSPPTLAELGVNKKKAAQIRSMSSVPAEVFEAHVAETKAAGEELTSAGLIKIGQQFKKEAKRKEKQSKLKESTVSVDSAVWHGDMRELGKRIESNTVDLILTDPPYPGEFLPLFSELSVLAARVLKPGGLCLVYSGQIFLPDVMTRLCESLEYAWTFAIRHSGGNQRIFKVNVNTAWKPVIALYKPPLSIWWDSFIDVVSGGREKDLHEWQQAESEAAYFIEHLTLPGQIVVDPFCGSGTVLKAAKELGRQYQGIELDSEHVQQATRRLST